MHFSVAKPLIADGSAKSHELSLAYDQYSLQKLEPPLVLQEFVNHGNSYWMVFTTLHFSNSVHDQYLSSNTTGWMCLMHSGGVLFKVFIVGEAIRVVRRFSLPNVTKRQLSRTSGVYRFPRVSCAVASADDADLDPNVAGKLPSPNLTAYSLFPFAQVFVMVCFLFVQNYLPNPCWKNLLENSDVDW